MNPARKLPIRPTALSGQVSDRVLRRARNVPFDETAPRGAASSGRPLGGASPGEGEAPFSESAFTDFVKGHFGRVSEHARRLRLPRDMAEDILQLAFEKLFPYRAMIERSRWEGWLRTTMLLCSLHHLRGVRRARKNELDVTFLLQEFQTNASPEVETYQRECADQLLDLLQKLAPERCAVVSLYLVDDLPMKEVAARLGISENTAKDRWRLACIDMGNEWERGRARERTRKRFAALVSTVVAFLVALWRRVWGSPRRGRTLLACAACAMLLQEPTAAPHEIPVVHSPDASAVSARVEPPGPPGTPPPALPAPHVSPTPPDTHAPADTPAAPKSHASSGAHASSNSHASLDTHASPNSHASLDTHASRNSRAPRRSGALLGARAPLASPAPQGTSAAVGGRAAPGVGAAPPSSGAAVAVAPAAGDGAGQRAIDGASPGVDRRRVEMAHKDLANVLWLHRHDKPEAARALLELYRITYADDPLPAEHAAVAAAVAARAR